MYDLDEISDDYDLDLVVVKYEGTKQFLDELLKHFYLDLVVDWLNQNWSPWRAGTKINNRCYLPSPPITEEVENAFLSSNRR